VARQMLHTGRATRREGRASKIKGQTARS
jgi:hypothetical protein